MIEFKEVEKRYPNGFEALKHINPHVLQDIEDAIILESFKGMKADKIRDFIEND